MKTGLGGTLLNGGRLSLLLNQGMQILIRKKEMKEVFEKEAPNNPQVCPTFIGTDFRENPGNIKLKRRRLKAIHSGKGGTVGKEGDREQKEF